jgi:hypothetical protein
MIPFTQIGEVQTADLVFNNTNAKIVEITNFSISTTNESGTTKYLFKEFALSTDGILFTSFKELNVANLNRIKFKQKGYWYVRIRLTRKGVDSSGVLIFNSFDITGTNETTDNYSIGVTTNKSIFQQSLGYNLITQELALNLFEKLIIGNGMLPNFVERNVDENSIRNLFYNPTASADEDFLVIWKSVIQFLSMVDTFAENLNKIYFDSDLLLKFLRSKGLYFSGNEDLQTLQYIATNYFREFSHRGTILMFKRKDEILADGSNCAVKGEVLRLLNVGDLDEFLYSFNSDNWCIGKSSPLYRGISDLNMNKEVSDEISMANLSNYNSFGVVEQTISHIKYFKIYSSNNSTYKGIGYNGELPTTPLKSFINIDKNMSYIISFYLKSQEDNNKLYFGIDCYSEDSELLSYATLDKNGNQRNNFFNFTKIPRVDDLYLVRGIIHNQGTNLLSLPYKNELNWSVYDEHLAFNSNSDIIPKFLAINIGNKNLDYSSNSFLISNLKMFPLKTPNSRYFVQNKNFMNFFAKNNNSVLSNEQIEQIMRNELLPLSVNFKTNYL